MIKHIVFWIVKDEAEGLLKSEVIAKMKSMLEALPQKIDVIRKNVDSKIDIKYNRLSLEILSEILMNLLYFYEYYYFLVFELEP